MTEQIPTAPLIVVTDDDPDDCLMIRDAFQECPKPCRLHFVHDGDELIRYLRNSACAADRTLPDMILLDLNMPLKDGRQALRDIKDDPTFRRIPTVVLTTSQSEDDIEYCYNHGANSYIVKPARYSELVAVARSLQSYWLDTVHLPQDNRTS